MIVRLVHTADKTGFDDKERAMYGDAIKVKERHHGRRKKCSRF